MALGLGDVRTDYMGIRRIKSQLCGLLTPDHIDVFKKIRIGCEKIGNMRIRRIDYYGENCGEADTPIVRKIIEFARNHSIDFAYSWPYRLFFTQKNTP